MVVAKAPTGMFIPHVHDIGLRDISTSLRLSNCGHENALSPEFQRQPIETEYLRKEIKAKPWPVPILPVIILSQLAVPWSFAVLEGGKFSKVIKQVFSAWCSTNAESADCIIADG